MEQQLKTRVPVVRRAFEYGDRTAVIDSTGHHSYRELLEAAGQVASGLLGPDRDLQEARIAFLVDPDWQHITAQWGIWLAGGVAVPLCCQHPPREWEQMLRDAGAHVLIIATRYADAAGKLSSRIENLKIVSIERLARNRCRSLPAVDRERRALILYTSGTTGQAKGVVSTHGNLMAQIEALIEAWQWSPDDRILQILPLHHVHGLVNVVGCALWSGAVCQMQPGFAPEAVWNAFLGGKITLLMAVPTIYVKLIQYWESLSPNQRSRRSAAARHLRLMVSGSAALPVNVCTRWGQITRHTLLERYGMTETGMILSNPLVGERRPGSVGVPLPGVKVRLVDETGQSIKSEDRPGRLEVRGPGVFLEYWQRPEETRRAFRNGWFQTGDVATLERGYYRILGRESVDIIKTGGFRVSALEIEEVLRRHEAIQQCAVVGVEDPTWGERVAVAVVWRGGPLSLERLREWAGDRMARYKIPTRLISVENLPRNMMGKVTKPAVKRFFEPQPAQ